MEKFLFAFHGGNMPEDPAEGEKIMAKWGTWMEGLGQAMLDPGSIIEGNTIVGANGAITDEGGNDLLSGYMIITATSKEAAIEIAKGCPILENNGTVEVGPLLNM